MTRQEIIEGLTLIFRDVFKDSNLELSESMTANDVERWDSLTHMLMINEVEKKFEVKFKLKDLNKMKNVGNLIEILEERVK